MECFHIDESSYFASQALRRENLMNRPRPHITREATHGTNQKN